jgi:hypothetical protein
MLPGNKESNPPGQSTSKTFSTYHQHNTTHDNQHTKANTHHTNTRTEAGETYLTAFQYDYTVAQWPRMEVDG